MVRLDNDSKDRVGTGKLQTSNGDPVNTLITATLNKQGNNNNTYITEHTEEVYNGGSSMGERTKHKQGNAKTKRLPPGVRLYNQSKNPKAKSQNKRKDDAPPKPVLTKNVEEMLIKSNREK